MLIRSSFFSAHTRLFTHKGTIGHWGNNDRDMLMCANDVVISPYKCKWSERLTLTQQGIRCGFTSTPACVCVCVCLLVECFGGGWDVCYMLHWRGWERVSLSLLPFSSHTWNFEALYRSFQQEDTLSPIPLTLKLHKLKLQIEKVYKKGNTSISHINYHKLWYFLPKAAMETLFFAFAGHIVCNKESHDTARYAWEKKISTTFGLIWQIP